jgi:hypothetical protein
MNNTISWSELPGARTGLIVFALSSLLLAGSIHARGMSSVNSLVFLSPLLHLQIKRNQQIPGPLRQIGFRAERFYQWFFALLSRLRSARRGRFFAGNSHKMSLCRTVQRFARDRWW